MIRILKLSFIAMFALAQPVAAEQTASGVATASSTELPQLSLLLPAGGTWQPNETAVNSVREPTTNASSDYSILEKFVQIADASGDLSNPPRGEAPKDAVHARIGLEVPAQSGSDAYAVLSEFMSPRDATPAHPQATPPSDAIHAGLVGTSALPAAGPADDYAVVRDFLDTKDDAKPIVLAANSPAAKKPAPKIDASTGSADTATYVGSEACVKCHKNQFGSFSVTLHGSIMLKQPRSVQEKLGCESCHGPASQHIKSKEADSGAPGDIMSFRKDSPRPVEERNAVCLSCHEHGDRTYWNGSTHETRGLACTNCHQIMEKVSVKHQLIKSTELETCFQCHKDRRAQLVRSSHMPVANGDMTCSSCHNPHGSATDKLLREASVNETCYKCHADKRGPFLWEHEPVRDNCLNCHEPHGTVNEYMLKIQRPRLCQSCHMGPGHGNPGNPMTVQSVNRSCQNCHTMVHGSNSPAGMLFQR